MKDGPIRTLYMVIAGAITVASASVSIGMAMGKATTPTQEKLEGRIQTLERLCERWDERWTNLQGWMTSIDAKLTRMEGN